MRNELSQVKELFAERAQESAKVANDSPEETEAEVSNEVEEETEITQEVSNEEETETEAKDPDEEAADEVPVLTDEPYSMKSLAAAIEIDQQELYGVMVPLRDGAEPISIGEMKNKYQDMIKENESNTARIQELEQTTSQPSAQQQASQAEFQAQVALARIQEEYNAVDWADLDEFDKAESVLKRQKFTERYNQAQSVLYQAGQQREIDHNQNLQVQKGKMLELVPEWKDEAVQTAEMNKLNTIMLDAGYPEEIIRTNVDPISLSLLRELMMLRDEKTKSAEMVKRVKKAPTSLKGRKVAPVTNKEKVNQAVATAKRTGNKHDELNAAKAILSAGNT